MSEVRKSSVLYAYRWAIVGVLFLLISLLAGCAAPDAQVVTETVIVEKEVEVEKEVTRLVEVTKEVTKKVTVLVKETVVVENVITATPPPTPRPKPTASVGGRKNPAALGDTVVCEREGNVYEVSITEIVGGAEAAKRVADANMFNDTVKEGSEFVLFYAQVKLVKTAGEGTVGVSDSDWTLVDASGELWRVPMVVGPSPEFGGNGFEGATFEGWAVHIRQVGEAVSLVFDLGYDGMGGAWFAVPA